MDRPGRAQVVGKSAFSRSKSGQLRIWKVDFFLQLGGVWAMGRRAPPSGRWWVPPPWPTHHPAATAPPPLSVNFGRRVLVLLRLSGWWGALARERRVVPCSMIPRVSGTVQYDLMVCQGCVGGGQGEGAAYDVRRQNKENGLKTAGFFLANSFGELITKGPGWKSGHLQ